jgi:K(+)-stimulated pyrophosphate-energized sodium pump
MNLVALLIAPLIVRYSVGAHHNTPLRIVIALVAFGIIVVSVVISKRRSVAVGGDGDGDTGGTEPAPSTLTI